MKATYRIKALPEVLKSFGLVQSNSKDELFEALGFCDRRSGGPLCSYQEEKRNRPTQNSLCPPILGSRLERNKP
jgi:hypothetical protein